MDLPAFKLASQNTGPTKYYGLTGKLNAFRRSHSRFLLRPGFPRPLTEDQGLKALARLGEVSDTINKIEKDILASTGLKWRCNQVEAMIFPAYNSVIPSILGQSLMVSLGDPRDYEKFFKNADAKFARHIAHLATAILPDGTIRYGIDTTHVGRAKTCLMMIGRGEGGRYKYLRGVDLRPFSLMTSDDDLWKRPELMIEWSGLHRSLNELLAHRMAELLLGTKTVRQMVADELGDPQLQQKAVNGNQLEYRLWAATSYSVLLQVFGLQEKGFTLLGMLNQYGVHGKKWFGSADDIKEKMIAFYNGVRLVHKGR